MNILKRLDNSHSEIFNFSNSRRCYCSENSRKVLGNKQKWCPREGKEIEKENEMCGETKRQVGRNREVKTIERKCYSNGKL